MALSVKQENKLIAILSEKRCRLPMTSVIEAEKLFLFQPRRCHLSS